MRSIFFAALTLALAGATSAQTRKEMADKVVKQYDAPSAACALLRDAEVIKITGRKSHDKPAGTQLTNGGSSCDYDVGANVTLFSGPKSAEHYEALLKNFKKDKKPRQAVSGIGDSAFLLLPDAGDARSRYKHAVLVVRKGVHTLAVALEAEGAAPESLQPTLTALARAALPRLPQ